MSQRGCRELGDVVDEYEVGVEVHHALHAGRDEVGQVAARVVEGAIECGADGGGDEARNDGVVEGVELEIQVGECVGDCGA